MVLVYMVLVYVVLVYVVLVYMVLVHMVLVHMVLVYMVLAPTDMETKFIYLSNAWHCGASSEWTSQCYAMYHGDKVYVYVYRQLSGAAVEKRMYHSWCTEENHKWPMTDLFYYMHCVCVRYERKPDTS